MLKGCQKQGWSQARLSFGEGTGLRTAPSSPHTPVLELPSVSIARVQGSSRSSSRRCCERTENPAGVVQAGWKESRTTPGKITSRKSSSCCPLHELSLLGRTQEGLFLKSSQHMAAALPGASAAHQEGTGKHQCPHLLPGGAPRAVCTPQAVLGLGG